MKSLITGMAGVTGSGLLMAGLYLQSGTASALQCAGDSLLLYPRVTAGRKYRAV